MKKKIKKAFPVRYAAKFRCMDCVAQCTYYESEDSLICKNAIIPLYAYPYKPKNLLKVIMKTRLQ